MAQVMIPTPLRTYTRGQKTVRVSGKTVDEVLSSLTSAYPDLKRHLFSEDGRLRNFVNIYLGDEDVRYLHQGATMIRETDTLSIVPSVAGGAVEVLKADKVLDCRGLLCPMPVIRIAQAIHEIAVGQTLELLTTDRGSKADITAWGKQTGHQVLDVREQNQAAISQGLARMPSLEEMIDIVRHGGGNLYACTTTMGVMGVRQSD